MSSKPESTSISSWLAELRMECYKKHLEDFDTIKPLMEFKDIELKKLGVVNSKDRAMMMGSLASYKKESGATSPVVAAVQLQDKSTQRRGSFKKLKLKNILNSGSARKSKKKADSFSSSVASTVRVQEVTDTPLSPTVGKPPSSTTDDYEEVPDLSPRSRTMTSNTKAFQNWKAVENEYVPTPDSSPRFDEYRTRSNTISSFDRHSETSNTSSSISHPSSYTPEIQYRQRIDLAPKDDSPGALKHRHLSGVSMESGLSFGYDVEKDFNPTLPLENQPWFRGKISRSEAEGLLNDDGDFIVRENTVVLNTCTLSLRWRGVHDHTMINTTDVINTKGDIARETGVKYHFESGAFDSIPELIFNHLKYQIPIDTAQHTLITNPICRPGSTTNSTPGSAHRTFNSSMSYTPAHPTENGSESSSTNNTLPRNFGRKSSNPTSPDDSPKTAYTITRGSVPSPHIYARHPKVKAHNSSGDILEETSRYDFARGTRNVMSPPPIAEFRARAMTTTSLRVREANSASGAQHSSPVHRRQESFGDYEFMGSVSLSSDTPENPDDVLDRSRTHTLPANSRKATATQERVNYAEIVCLKDPKEKARKFAVADASSGRESVKYAEVRFAHSKGSHPVINPSSTDRNTSPYQARAELLANKVHGDSNSATPNPPGVGYARIKIADPHPFSQYASIQKSTPSSSASSREGSPQIARNESHMYARPDKSMRKKKNRTSTTSNDSVLSASSSHSSSPAPISSHPHTVLANVHSHATSAKVHRELPGYDTLVKIHSLLQSHSNKQLAYHLTRADAVAFMLAPRPGEEDKMWKERVSHVTSSSGMYSGLQTLADPDGEKLWKKLYFRHLNLSQLVTLSIITAGDALERAKLLHRFIDIAFLLQSGKFGNLYSFIAIVQGTNVPQIADMVDVWDLLRSNFPKAASAHKELLSIISNLNEGIAMFATENLTIPAIQHLKTVFHFSEPSSLQGFNPSGDDRSFVGEYWSLACGLDGIRTIVSHTSQFTFNARKKLGGRKYDAKVMDFFTQDFTRVYLQSIGVHVDDPMERRRRFGVLMDALVVRVDASESV